MNLLSFDLNLLRVLDALLSEGSTVRAGERLGLSQPAVSAALSRLRHALSDPLFVRQGQGLVATDYARGLEVPVRAILDQTEALLAGPGGFDPERETRAYRLSGSDFFSELLIPELAARIGRKAPGVRVQQVDLVPDNSAEIIERLDVDLALLPDTSLPSWAEHQKLFRAPYVMIARQGHSRLAEAGIAPGTVVPLELFCDLGFVAFSTEGKLSLMGDAALAKVGRTRRVVMTMPVFSGVGRVVARSDLVALVPAQFARSVAPGMGLEIFHAPIEMPMATISMVWHRRHSSDAFHIWMRSQIAAILTRLDMTSPDGP